MATGGSRARGILAAIVACALVLAAAAPASAATGIDVSSWQHDPGNTPIHWPEVRGDGHTFAFVKADEGPWAGRPSYYTNPYFASDWEGAASVGMYRGAYHYAQPKSDPSTAIDDARHMISVTGTMRGPTDLPPVLDLEEHRDLSPDELIAWTGTWLDEIQRLTGRKAIIYTGRHFWETRMANTHHFSDYPLWIASWFQSIGPGTTPGRLPGGWSTWTFWQWTDDGRVSGIEGQVDLNRYCCPDGNLAALANGTAGDQGGSNPFGVLDQVALVGDDQVSLIGWGIDPDTRSPLAVHVYVDGQRYPRNILAGWPREDVAAAFPGWGPDHGLRITVPMTRGQHEVCAYLLNQGAGTSNFLLGCRAVDVPGGPQGFRDVQGWHAFVDDISWLSLNSLATGFPDGTFGPAEPMTRQAAAAFLHRYADWIGAELEPVTSVEFTDVPPDHAFYDEISWLASTGITQGYEDGSFRPEGVIARQAMAAFLARLFVGMGGTLPDLDSQPFTDVPPDHPFHDEIDWLASAGIAEGYEDGGFGAGLPMARQAAAAFLHRFDASLP